MNTTEANTFFLGQAEVWKNVFSYVDFMALKCAVDLGIPDILHSENRPLSLSEIASKIADAPSPNIPYLFRIMRLLTHKKIFSSSVSPGGDTLYGSSSTSQFLSGNDHELSLAPFLLLLNHVYVRSTWDQLSACVREGGHAFHKANGCELFDRTAQNPEFNKLFNESMIGCGNITVDAILFGFDKDAWNGLESLVDVGGGDGYMIAKIVNTYPQIKGINFDLPHVVATAAKHDGVTNVGGDMFDVIPDSDAVFLKWVMHNWDDESCVKILQNCKKAIPENGKIFIADSVLDPEVDEAFGSTGLAIDLLMMAVARGMQRTEVQWKAILEKGGFPRYKITKLPTIYSIIEAYPN